MVSAKGEAEDRRKKFLPLCLLLGVVVVSQSVSPGLASFLFAHATPQRRVAPHLSICLSLSLPGGRDIHKLLASPLLGRRKKPTVLHPLGASAPLRIF